MPADLDITDGQTSFVSAHTMGWHQLGTLLENDFTAEQAMKHGLLGGWNVRKWPAYAVNPETGENIPVPGMNAVVRDNPVRPSQVDVLSKFNVSDGFTIIQNEEHAGFLNALVEESGAHFDTAGAINGGRQVFITMKMPGHLMVGGDDKVDSYIAAVNSHDGSMSFTMMVTPVRIVCSNTLNMAFHGASHMFRVRHSSGAEKALRTQARESLDMTFKYLDGFQEEANQLINTTMNQSKFEEIVRKEFGASEDSSSAVITRADNRISEMERLFADANTQDGIRDTAWAGLMALTEYADHYSETRGEDKETSRALKSILDPAFKNRARRIMLQEV